MTTSARFLLFDPSATRGRRPAPAGGVRRPLQRREVVPPERPGRSLPPCPRQQHPRPDARHRPLRGGGTVRLRGPSRVRSSRSLPFRAGMRGKGWWRDTSKSACPAARLRAGGRAARPEEEERPAGGVPRGAAGAVPLGWGRKGTSSPHAEGDGRRTVRRRTVACRGAVRCCGRPRERRRGSTCSGGTSVPLFPS